MATSQRRRTAGERRRWRRDLGAAENTPSAIPIVPESFIVVASPAEFASTYGDNSIRSALVRQSA